MFEVVAELPMFALTLHVEATPMHIGSRLRWLMLAGDDTRAPAKRDLIANQFGAEVFAAAATYSISSVMRPRTSVVDLGPDLVVGAFLCPGFPHDDLSLSCRSES